MPTFQNIHPKMIRTDGETQPRAIDKNVCADYRERMGLGISFRLSTCSLMAKTIGWSTVSIGCRHTFLLPQVKRSVAGCFGHAARCPMVQLQCQ